jgi:hypothetical protein
MWRDKMVHKVKQYDVGAPFAFEAYKGGGTDKLPLDDVVEAVVKFKIGDGKLQERNASIELTEGTGPDIIKYSWLEGDLDDHGLMLLEVLIRFSDDSKFTSLGYVRILVQKVLE